MHHLLLASVGALMARQFVGTRETTLASVPAAGKRLFTRVSSQMGLQMRRFKVILAAAFKIALVNAATLIYLFLLFKI